MRPFGRSMAMSTIIRFPLSRTAAGRNIRNAPTRTRWQTDPPGAHVIILPVVRIERQETSHRPRPEGSTIISGPFVLELDSPQLA